MADLSAISPDSIKALEEAMRAFGVAGVRVDGDASDLTPAQIVPFLDKLSRALGEDGVSFGAGDSFMGQDFVNPETRDDEIKKIAASVRGFRDSAQLGLVREILSDDPNFSKIQEHLNSLGVQDAAATTKSIRNGLNNYGAQTVLYGTSVMGLQIDGVIDTAEKLDPNFAKLRDILGDQVLDNVVQTVALIDGSEAWFEVVDALKPDVSGAEVASVGAAIDAEVEVEEAVEVDAKKERIKLVEEALGIDVEAQDGVWGNQERALLRERIKDIQINGPIWLGDKTGIYTQEYADYVLSGNSGFRPEDVQLFQQLAELQKDNVILVAKEDLHANSDEVKTAVATVEQALKALIPVVQGELDERRADAQKLIDSIEKGALSKTEVNETIKAIADANAVLQSDASDEAKAEALRVKESAQEYLDSHSGLADNIGAFIDGFIFMGEENFGRTDFGKKIIETGKAWAIDSIKGRLDSVNDLPSVDSLNLDDGVLDIRDQTALQGVTFLLAQKLGIPGNDNWRYTPELGQQILSRLDRLTFEEKEKLVLAQLTDEQIADYQNKSDEDKKAFLDEQAKVGTTALLAAMDTLHEAGVLVPQRLYYHEEVKVPDLTKEIFEEFLEGKRDTLNTHYHEAEATPVERNVMNLMVYDFTQGFELASIMGEDYDVPSDIAQIDPTQTAAIRFAEMYKQDVDLNEMYDMLSTLPFGTQERRMQFEVLFKALETLENDVSDEEFEATIKELEAAKFSQDLIKKVREAEESGNITVEILASIYGDGVSQINANPAAGSHYLFSSQRHVTIDPRLDDFELQVGSQKVSADDIFKLHKDQNNNFHPDNPYEATYFKAEDGTLYVAAVDFESKIFQIEVLDLEGWRRVVAENQRQPGESARDNSVRLDKALSDVSGYDLLFQKMHESGQATIAPGSIYTFPDMGFLKNLPTYGAVKADVDAEVAQRNDERFKERIDAAIPDALPEGFEKAANPPSQDNQGPSSLDAFNKNPIDQDLPLDVSVPQATSPEVNFQTGQ